MSGDLRLQKVFCECHPSQVRNVCIVAHVDHGKTTLADFLVSANGIISARLAGKLRYMDNREDEQTRGITMKSSAITLYYEPLLLNLIDSPGHVDFCTEVNSAINLADIAILLVDAIEGVCSQTESLIRQALVKRLDILLVINKLDRLVVELKMSEAEAHRHLQRLIEYVNACLAKAIQGQLLEEDWHTFDQVEKQLHFEPTKGNVLFASALHGYAFALEDFAQLWAKRIFSASPHSDDNGGQKQLESLRTQLGIHLFSRDHFFATSSKQIQAGADKRGKKTLFEQFILEPLWDLHKCALVDKDVDRLKHLASRLSIPQLKGRRPDEAFAELMRHWLPLSSAVVRACARMRSAERAYQMDDGRLGELFRGLATDEDEGKREQRDTLLGGSSSVAANALFNCKLDDPLILVFVAKSFKVEQRRVSLCRVMSGTLQKDITINVLTRQSSFSSGRSLGLPANVCRQIRIGGLYLLLGRELLPVDHVPCGRICGIEAADGEWISGPLLSSHQLALEETPRFDLHQKFAEPLVRVTIRPRTAGMPEFTELRSALRQLAVLDSAVRILEQENGDLAMLTAGEVHLQKCLEDLNALGQTDIDVSEPIVPFLETLLPDIRLSYAKILSDHFTECYLRQFCMRIRLRAIPLNGVDPESHKLMELLKQNAHLIDTFREGLDDHSQLDSLRYRLVECACDCLPRLKGSWWAKRPPAEVGRLFSNIWAFGPAKAKFNILFCNYTDALSVWRANLRPLEQAIVVGFHMAMAQGPLCDEPMQGVGILLEGLTLEEAGENGGEPAALPVQLSKINNEDGQERGRQTRSTENDEEYEEEKDMSEQDAIAHLQTNAQLQGQLISAIRQACRAALKKQSDALRLLAAMYDCRVQVPAQTLGKVQAVLAQKRAKVHSDEVNELTGLFEIGAHLPVVESFSFCEDLRKRTSGTASAQLEFSGWELIDEDPHWEPKTEEEVEEFGRHGALKNQARQYMDAVRKRKGLLTEDVIVISAEKQRNLTRNK